MESTISAIRQSILTQAPQVNNEATISIISMWIDILGVITSILLAFFTIAFGVIAYLTWKQNDLRKQAEKEVGKIVKIGNDMSAMLTAARKLSKETDKRLADVIASAASISDLDKKMKVKGAKVEELSKQLEGKVNNLNTSITSLASLPTYVPQFSSDDLKNFGAASIYGSDNIVNLRPATIEAPIGFAELLKRQQEKIKK